MCRFVRSSRNTRYVSRLRFPEIASYTLLGALAPQLYFTGPKGPRERTLLNSVLLSHSFLALVIQGAGFGSGGLFFFTGVMMFASLVVERFVTGLDDDGVWLGAYAIGQFAPLSIGAELFSATAQFFVPLVS